MKPANEIFVLLGILALLIVALLFMSLTAKAEDLATKDLYLVAVPGPYAVTDAELLDVYSRASYYFRELRIGFRMSYIRRGANPCPGYSDSRYAVYDSLECFQADAKQYTRKNLIVYYVTPPTVEGGRDAFIAGIADVCGDVAVGNAEAYKLQNGLLGEARIDQSATIMAHETAHLLCAKHYDKKINLMYSSANFYTSQYHGRLPVVKATKRQVRRAIIKQRRSHTTRKEGL